MKENMIIVKSATDCTLVINTPELKKTWNKKGSKMYVEREALEQAYYDPSVEALFRMGYLFVDDKTFLEDVGLIEPGQEESSVVELTDKLMLRLIKVMPLSEFKQYLKKLSKAQITDLGEYAIEHYTDLSNDRVDILEKVTGKNILNAISNYKKSKED